MSKQHENAACATAEWAAELARRAEAHKVMRDLIEAGKKNELCSESESKQNPLAHQEGGDHYRNLAIQPVKFIQANKLSFLEGCVIKRVCRHRNKAGAEDIRKAIHELQLIMKLEYPDDV